MSYAKSKWPYLGLSNKEQRLIQSKIHHPKSKILTVDFGFWITPGWKLGSDLDVSKVQKTTRQFGAGCSVLPWSIKFSGNRFRFPKISILVLFAGNWRRETASKKNNVLCNLCCCVTVLCGNFFMSLAASLQKSHHLSLRFPFTWVSMVMVTLTL